MDVRPMSFTELFVVQITHRCPTNFSFVAFFVSIRVEIKSVNDKLKFVGQLFYGDLSSSFISGVSRLSFVKSFTPVSITFGGVWPLSFATIALTDS